MADTTTVILLESTPLLSSDAAGLAADILPKALWEPSFILQTRQPSSSAIPINADGDIWRVLLASTTPMKAFVFYPLALTATFVGTLTFPVFWETAASYSIDPPIKNTVPRNDVWKPVTMPAVKPIFDGSAVLFTQTCLPSFAGFPPRPVVNDQDVGTTNNSLAGFQFTTQTYDATIDAAMSLSIDARWLAFPRTVARNTGYWMPALFYKTN